MNKNCSNHVDTVVSGIQRLLDDLYELSNSTANFKLMNFNFIDLGFIKYNSKGYINKFLSFYYLLEIKSEVLRDLQRLLDSIPMISDILNNDELMCLEFIKEFGVINFIGIADADCIDKLLSLFKVIEFKCSVLFSHNISMQSEDSYHLNKHKRAERRISDIKVRTRIVQLGSANVYSEDGTLVRSEGIISKKFRKINHEGPKYAQVKNAIRFHYRTKRLTRLAELYEDYPTLYRGRYFKEIPLPDVSEDTEDTAVKNGKKDVYFVQILEELAGCEYRYSGKYVKVHGNDNADASPEDTVSEYPSEKGDVPMSVRRNKHSVNISPSDKMQMNTNKMLPISTCEVSLKPFVTTPNRSYGFL